AAPSDRDRYEDRSDRDHRDRDNRRDHRADRRNDRYDSRDGWWDGNRDAHRNDHVYRDDRVYRNDRVYRDRRLGRNDRIWRGNDHRYYCRRDDGTAGAVVGGISGGVLGGVIAPRGSKTLGAISAPSPDRQLDVQSTTARSTAAKVRYHGGGGAAIVRASSVAS